MPRAFTVSEAKPKLGSLLDKAGSGQPIYLRRKERLYRIELVPEVEPIPTRPFGYFVNEPGDPFVDLLNAAAPSFDPEK